MTISLSELGVEPAKDQGTTWHPDRDGDLPDLDQGELALHCEKRESHDLYDGFRRRAREGRDPGAAEDSEESPEGEV